jgi:hypothetical protein
MVVKYWWIYLSKEKEFGEKPSDNVRHSKEI